MQLKRFLIFLGALAVTAAVCAQHARAASPQANYRYYCAQCHGLEGRADGINARRDFPADPRNFTDAKEMKKLTDEDIMNAIAGGGAAVGKSAVMPPFSGVLSPDEIRELKDFVRKFCACGA